MTDGDSKAYEEMMARAAGLAAEGRVDEAVGAYRRAADSYPHQPGAHYELGLLHHRRGEVDQAVVRFERAAALMPRDASVWNNLGVLHLALRDHDKAEQCFRHAVSLDAAYADAWYGLGRTLMHAGRPGEGSRAWRQCLVADPTYERARRALANLDAVDPTQPGGGVEGAEGVRILVLSPSDAEKDPARRVLWGDHWVKTELEREFAALGLVVVEENPDVILYLRGAPISGLPRETYNIVWLYSHPDTVTAVDLKPFDKIFCLSPGFAPKLEALGYRDVEVMIGATSKAPIARPIQHDVVFVGNARGPQGRRVVADLGNTPHNLKVWGEGWDQLLPPRYYGGRYYPYDRLDELYASALISINDHHPDMAREGFVAVRIFDILASGGFAISDRNAGIAAIFGDTVPQYDDARHLAALLDHYIAHPEEREALARRGREIALAHTWQRRARRFAEAAVDGLRARRLAGPRVRPPARSSSPTPGDRPRVLYVDTISEPTAACNVHGLMRAYERVSVLHPFDYRRLAAEAGPEGMNRALFEAATAFRPEMIHLGKCESVCGATIRRIKEAIDTFVVHFYGDFRWHPQPWVVDLGRHVDCTLFSHTDERILARYRALGVANLDGWWDAGTDPDVFYPRAVTKSADIVLLANNVDLAHDGYAVRRALVEAFAEAGFDIHVYGHGWGYLQDRPWPNLHLHPFVSEGRFAEVCSGARITLGINGVNDVRMYASWRRAVNAMASGAFHLTHYVPGMETLFQNRQHLVWFHSVAEALELARYYLSHEEEREVVAAAGRAEVLQNHTWDARVAQMMHRLERHHAYADLRAFEGVSDPEIERRGTAESFRAAWEATWNARPRDTPESIRSAYRETDAYLFRGVYHNFHTQRQRFQFTRDIVRRYSELFSDRAVRVVDYGCGPGCLDKWLLDIPNVHLALADVDSPSLDFCRFRFAHEDRVRVIAIDEQACLDGLYDVIICYDVLEHIPEPLPIVEHFTAHLRDGGLLFLFFCTSLPEDHPSGHLGDSIAQYPRVMAHLQQHYAALGGHLYQKGVISRARASAPFQALPRHDIISTTRW